MIQNGDSKHSSLSLLTDLYQFSMAYGYWKAGMDEKEAVFHMFYRSVPFKGRFCVACGLDDLMRFIDNFRFEDSDTGYLASLKGSDGQALFEDAFLKYLSELKFTCDIDAIPEGTPVFPFEPMIRVQGSIIQCQLLESIILNIVNFQTLVATKSVRICHAAQGDPVLEFGLRRAQGIDGALSASRAAYIGGCAGTSNVLAGKLYDIPVRGTMSHSWIMAFESEIEAFQTYADIMPNHCVFLVDTYSTIKGIKNAIQVGQKLREKGYELGGIRLDSGDLAYLSIEARKTLDESGFKNTQIVVSNELDESIIQSLKIQKAQINIWGVGTKLVTSYDQPALDGVYKLAAIRHPGGKWENKIKISEQTIKVTIPGIQQVRRYFTKDLYLADLIFDIGKNIENGCKMIDPFDITRQKVFTGKEPYEDLLVPIYKKGEKVYDCPSIDNIRKKTQFELRRLHPTIRRLVNPHRYPVGEEESLLDQKMKLTIQARQIR